ncbi:lipid II flippase MurJ [Rhodoplanes sp. TEM]|uniref:Lipid II flippase MurJ n=1 Tax=Rhodoplanes tepidamans TaxID=200616 RepID=A0ABT5JBS8_RHOTP|nr:MULTISPECIES: lipid II flippase MurJ [Rhodoplanes]MDC7787140.1 lipid II flippase MurJ [Rhodoplanes tepidamans]MDC7984296.1 lipid II flippase MurJ [Rhodoplanes sp. TEM]MDQ0356093.1 putative peptidoglycan lipid II flippase [Rhodoplanes tepidamans]
MTAVTHEPPPSARARSTRRLVAVLMGGALVSKLLGFARELLMAQVLGASLVADGFRGALTAILLPLAFLQNESVPAILIPIQRDAHVRGDAAQRLASLTVALTLLAVLLMLAVQAAGAFWVDAVVGGFVAEGRALTLDFVRIMALGMPASVALNVLAAGEIALGRSRITNLRAGLLNICIMLGLVLLVLTGRLDVLAWAFTIAFNALAVWGVWALWREGEFSFAGARPALALEAGLDFLRRLRPLLALPFAEQINVWVERMMASRIATGTVASLDYARTLTESAVLLVSQPVGLGVLSSHPPVDERARVEALAAPVLAVALPASVYLVVFAPDVVRLVFFRGAFTEHGVLLTSQALRGIAVGLWASTLGWILLRTLNSTGRNLHAAAILIAAYAANVAVNLATSGLQTATQYGPLIIGLGEAVRSLVLLGGTILALECRRRVLVLVLIGLGPAAVMAGLGWLIHTEVTGTLPRLVAGGFACLFSIAVAAAVLMPATCRAVLDRIRKRLFDTRRS